MTRRNNGADVPAPNGRGTLVDLTNEQSAAVSALVDGDTPDRVAVALGVELVTVETWLADPAFVAAVNRRRADAVAAHVDRLRALVPDALDVLADVLRDGEPRDRLAAARVVLAASRDLPEPSDDMTPAAVETRWRKTAESRFLLSAF